MPFECPRCGAPELAITASMELPPDSRSDEISLQLFACSACGFGAIGVYEESRRGAMDDESMDHSGYKIPPGTVDSLGMWLAACPSPNDPSCACASHRELGARDTSGRWCGVDLSALGPPFALVLSGGHGSR
jgi:hypothetical protein